ncbi:hypothetical protein, partial [Nostocoides sp.]|uniref:hypothetical protein n=1 Tax=Nostocoides sp. TaxID=1917966 RepID=UPI003BAEA6FA
GPPPAAGTPQRVVIGFSRNTTHAVPTGTSSVNVGPDRGRVNRKHPFVWTKTADDILKKSNRQNTSNTAH